MHKICFVEKKSSFTGVNAGMPHMHQSTGPTPDPALKELITSLSVTDRPDLMIYRKFSEASKKGDLLKARKKLKSKKDGEDDSIVVNISTNNIRDFIYNLPYEILYM